MLKHKHKYTFGRISPFSWYYFLSVSSSCDKFWKRQGHPLISRHDGKSVVGFLKSEMLETIEFFSWHLWVSWYFRQFFNFCNISCFNTYVCIPIIWQRHYELFLIVFKNWHLVYVIKIANTGTNNFSVMFIRRLDLARSENAKRTLATANNFQMLFEPLLY